MRLAFVSGLGRNEIFADQGRRQKSCMAVYTWWYPAGIHHLEPPPTRGRDSPGSAHGIFLLEVLHAADHYPRRPRPGHRHKSADRSRPTPAEGGRPNPPGRAVGGNSTVTETAASLKATDHIAGGDGQAGASRQKSGEEGQMKEAWKRF